MSVKRIPTEVERRISTSSNIKNFTKAIEELVYNALDAKSTSIAVRIFIQEGSIQVVDNGCGISNKYLKYLGHRYYTSKYRSDLQTEYYGYRGLSLASIVEVSQKVKITSRHHAENSECTFTKIFNEGKVQEISETTVRPSKGTTVDVSGFLYNYHIQKNTVNNITEISRIKVFLERISLVHCNTSISLRDDSINEIVFQVNKHRDISQTIHTLYHISSHDIQELQVEKNEYKIHGFIEKVLDGDKNYRFIYVNGRFITNSQLQRSIDRRLKYNNFNRDTKIKRVFNDTEKVISEKIPFYFIFIKCPTKDYDINDDNEETLIKFKKWDKIDKLVEKLIKFYRGDLKVKEISNSYKENRNEFNEVTRKQVRNIVQKILDNDDKRPKRLRLRAGIIGKNATRKDNKKYDKLSVSKIVTDQFKSRYDEFYRNNISKHKNYLSASTFLTIKNNKEIHLQIKNREKDKTREINYLTNLKHNKIRIEDWKIKQNYILTSQDSLAKKFENPTDTVLKRCNILIQDVKQYFAPNKAIDNIEYATSKPVLKQIEVPFEDRDITHKQAYIKTSHDLIKPIFNCGEVYDLNFSRRVKYNKKEKIKNFAKRNYALNNNCNQRVATNADRFEYYSKKSPANKRKKITNARSCHNSQITKTLCTVFDQNKICKKDTRKEKLNQYFKYKTNRRKIFSKNVYTEQSLHTIETFESHVKNNYLPNFESFGDKSYISHKTHRSQRTTTKVNESKVFTSINENAANYKCHKKSTTEIAENINNHYQVYKNKWKKAYKNQYFSDVTSEKVLSDSYAKILNTNPLTICETVYHNSTLASNDLRKVYDVYSNKDLSPKFENNNGYIQYNIWNENKIVGVNHTLITDNIIFNEGSKVYEEESHKFISINKTLCHDRTAKESVLEDNFYSNVSNINFINNENNSLRFDMTKETGSKANVNKASKNVFQKLEKPANSHCDFEIELHNIASENNAFVENYHNNVFIKEPKNHSSEGNIDFNKSFLYSSNEGIYRMDLDTSFNADENSKITEQKNRLITDEVASCKLNIKTDGLRSTEEFELNGRHSFMPKGMSQIVGIQYPKVAIFENLEPKYYDANIYDNFTSNLQTFSEVLEPNVQVINYMGIKAIRHVINPTSNDPIFDSQSLKEAKILGQVDNKFIGAKVTGKYSKVNTTSEFLVLFDQHAVDERIRLENNLVDYFDGDAWIGVSINIMQIKLPNDDILYLHNYKEKFTRLGLKWACNGDLVSINGIPKAILGKHSRQMNVIMKAVKGLISEEVEAIKVLKGNISLHPKSIMDLVFSEACRYAVKFGDKLQKSECVSLLRALSTCKLPFQCAHGRPVMAVLMELPNTSYEYKINMENVKKMNFKLSKYTNCLRA